MWGVFVKVTMEFHHLSADFYTQFGQCEEILTKGDRPYYVLLLELDSLTYGIPISRTLIVLLYIMPQVKIAALTIQNP